MHGDERIALVITPKFQIRHVGFLQIDPFTADHQKRGDLQLFG
jgi:hypothetical protein